MIGWDVDGLATLRPAIGLLPAQKDQEGSLSTARIRIDQGYRAGLEKSGVLNCLPWAKLQRLFRR